MKSFLKNLRFEKIIPAVLSLLVPGLGQLVKGELIKFFMILVLASITSYYTKGGMTIVVIALLWVWNVYDAYSN